MPWDPTVRPPASYRGPALIIAFIATIYYSFGLMSYSASNSTVYITLVQLFMSIIGVCAIRVEHLLAVTIYVVYFIFNFISDTVLIAIYEFAQIDQMRSDLYSSCIANSSPDGSISQTPDECPGIVEADVRYFISYYVIVILVEFIASIIMFMYYHRLKMRILEDHLYNEEMAAAAIDPTIYEICREEVELAPLPPYAPPEEKPPRYDNTNSTETLGEPSQLAVQVDTEEQVVDLQK
ncbi:hypothetical protein HDV06_000492 [Boothiomyces sp. JEL0866]|nr:hypothetical protein HDV06_000492 [Boothiomyces sp. JEL0866]